MLEVTPIRAFNDNYLWLFREAGSRDCGIVDPGDAAPVLQYLKEQNLNLAVIIITHHHGDHTGGISQLLENYNVPVYGPDSANIPAVTHRVKQGSQIDILGHRFEIIEIPGHTLDHIAYFSASDENQTPVLFCGDTLFAGGCGRVFEGTFPMMHESLQKLSGLPTETLVYCAHEYTLANLSFARAVTPNNKTLADRIAKEKEKRNRDIPTVPTSIKAELDTNPFLRCAEAEIIAAAARHSGRQLKAPEEVFGVIRSWKDSF